ncbi:MULTISPECIES: hypothetical protein [Prochlorococcus]|uniref:Uncharacterized protein n=1 Tax=Prochlorococcus marinus (strain SARG / CCMP1375 / SS120) TaxID=167539 RepID=Q7VBA6_PROMA|nr:MULTISPECIES: hypothetical protein [Prochlorococcus]AAQ00236.1 Predicted protein [Prochlorococcus marinus subsp. marinus str. CCMP1375]KGG14037.1 hypothetical protein EV04_0522 [Prochlorococcus marinus str. LG]KGG19169.1 hypothetical protein EV08_1656 [Prochlorococcus marinus str. SS2]KGG23290.1 hypothetical protein EV09_0914 [Prochlorococcus marinus str. SS35]KGG32475.1 hypothetical protein EV10_1590 [Prochlorococcus marinus str. SS51]
MEKTKTYFNLSLQQRYRTQLLLNSIRGKSWTLDLPVLVFDRCWLRLDQVRLIDLPLMLPPDASNEAPEMIYYRKLLSEGKDQLLAVQECWNEFGMEDFHRALRLCWHVNDVGNNGWTYTKYLGLIREYRLKINSSINTIPMIILARQDSKDDHKITWL